jgi:DNA sulfur modification protein DndB
MPDWKNVFGKWKLALELRQEKISSHATVLRALGGLGIDLIGRDDWQEQLADLEAIDWSKKNPEWENICVAGNSVLSNRQARAATKAFIKHKLHLALTDAERRMLPTGMLEGGSDRKEAVATPTPSEEDEFPDVIRVRG